MHASRLRRYHEVPENRSHRVPEKLVYDDEGDEAGELIQPARVVVPVELGIPVHVGQPEREMVDRSEVNKDSVEEEVEPVNTESGLLTDEMEVEVEPEPGPSSRVVGVEPVNKGELTPAPRQESQKVWSRWRTLLSSGSDTSDEEGVHNVQPVVEVEVLKGSTIPRKGSEGAAAYDVYSAQSYTLSPRTITAVDLNLQVAIPSGYYLQLGSRSGLCLKGLVIVGGIVDSDYRGPIQALVYNTTGEPFKLCKGQRIGQALVLAVEDVAWKEVESLPTTVRGSGRFGSTGL